VFDEDDGRGPRQEEERGRVATRSRSEREERIEEDGKVVDEGRGEGRRSPIVGEVGDRRSARRKEG